MQCSVCSGSAGTSAHALAAATRVHAVVALAAAHMQWWQQREYMQWQCWQQRACSDGSNVSTCSGSACTSIHAVAVATWVITGERRGCSDCGIHCVASLLQYLQTNLGGQRLQPAHSVHHTLQPAHSVHHALSTALHVRCCQHC